MQNVHSSTSSPSDQAELNRTDPARIASRRSFFNKSIVAGVAVAGAASLASSPHASAVPGTPSRASFFARQRFLSLQQHEQAHVVFLENFLGDAARPRPNFQGLEQPDMLSFLRVSRELENTGVGAYLGAADDIMNSDILAAAGSIAQIEARHAGYLNVLLDYFITDGVAQDDGSVPAADADNTNQEFETALTPQQVLTKAGPFVADLNGGPPIGYDPDASSAENDTAIVNFALALEYLEQEFYDINVPKFFPG